MKIKTTSVTQSANEVLETKEKKLYYLIVENSRGEKLTINVGQKTHDEIKKLAANDEPEKPIAPELQLDNKLNKK